MKRAPVLLTGAAAVTAVLAPTVLRPEPRIVWNLTASAPLGAYRVQPGARPAVGDYAVVRPPDPLAKWLMRRGYIAEGVPLLKRVAALPPSRVCRINGSVTINGAPAAFARERDRFGRPLPAWSGCRQLAPDEVFLLNTAAPDSLDGRYFGPLPAASIVGRATPLRQPEAR